MTIATTFTIFSRTHSCLQLGLLSHGFGVFVEGLMDLKIKKKIYRLDMPKHIYWKAMTILLVRKMYIPQFCWGVSPVPISIGSHRHCHHICLGHCVTFDHQYRRHPLAWPPLAESEPRDQRSSPDRRQAAGHSSNHPVNI